MERNTRLLPLLTLLVLIPVLLAGALLWLRARRAHAQPTPDKARAQMPATPLADAQCEPTPPRGPAVFSIGTAAVSSSDEPALAKEQDDASQAEESEAAPAAHDEVVVTAEPIAPDAPEGGVPDELLTEDVDEPPPAAPLEEAAPSAAPESVDAQQADAAASGSRNPMAHKSRKPLPPVIKRRSPLSAPPKPM